MNIQEEKSARYILVQSEREQTLVSRITSYKIKRMRMGKSILLFDKVLSTKSHQ